MLNFHRKPKKFLTEWFIRRDRMPLLARGARQVGKSYAIRSWATETLGKDNLLEINLEEQPQLKSIFEKDLVVERIIEDLNLFTGFNLRKPGRVLFIDEIQNCPQAIVALRYFYEKAPQLAVIGAGSLIEFALKEISFPVGRVESLYFSPITFSEFIEALGRGDFVKYLESQSLNSPVSELVHRELLDLLKKYYRIGGMPKVIASYVHDKDFKLVSEMQSILIQTYRDDFAKYGAKVDWASLRNVFSRVPYFICKGKIVYSKIDNTARAEKTRAAIELLNYAGILSYIFSTNAHSLPLNAHTRIDYFKLLFLDIGLLQHALGFDWRTINPDADLTTICDGQFAEQFVGQEILASRTFNTKYNLHYWDRYKAGSDAEIDYVIEHDGGPVPLEVKSGAKGTLKSLIQYAKEHSPENSFVLSQRNVERLSAVNFLPLYFASKL